MKITTLLLFLMIAPSLCIGETLKGVAKNSKGQIVYIEKHEIEKDGTGLNKLIRVEYSKPDGSIFANMTSDFSNHKTVPYTVFEDLRFKSKHTIRIVGSSVEFDEVKEGKSVSKKSVPLTESMVASQGFDNFIRTNLTKLSSDPVDFQFGILEKKDFYLLTGYKRKSNSAQEIEFGIRAGHWYLRPFVQELRVVYEASSMRLKSFEGRSNILDDSGSAQNVLITYQWDENP